MDARICDRVNRRLSAGPAICQGGPDAAPEPRRCRTCSRWPERPHVRRAGENPARERARHPPRRPRRLLRGRRAAGSAGAARPAGHRRWRRPEPAWRRLGGVATRRGCSASTRRCRCGPPGRLCPQGVFLPVDGRKYQAVSREVMAILRRYTPQVQPISIDEAFLDVTGSRALFGDGEQIGRLIKAAIHDEVGLTASVGVGSTKLIAKIASELQQAGRARRRAAGRGGGVPGAAADLAAVGRGRQDGRGAPRLRGRHDRRPRGARSRRARAAVRQARRRRSSTVPSAATRIPSRRATRRSRSGTSTRSTSTPPAATRSSGRCWAWPTASRGGCGRPA